MTGDGLHQILTKPPGGQFYGDIEWLYLVTAEVVDNHWTWFVEVRIPKTPFWDQPVLANTRVRHRKQTIQRLARQYRDKVETTLQAVASGGGS